MVDIGCFEVFVFMMVGYNGGLVLGIWFCFWWCWLIMLNVSLMNWVGKLVILLVICWVVGLCLNLNDVVGYVV